MQYIHSKKKMCPHFSSLKTSCSLTLVKPKFSLGNPMGIIYWVSSDHARTGTSNVCNLIVVSVHNSTSACLSTAHSWALNWFWCPRVRKKTLPRSMSRTKKLTLPELGEKFEIEVLQLKYLSEGMWEGC